MIAMIATGEIVDITTGDSKDGASQSFGLRGPETVQFLQNRALPAHDRPGLAEATL